MPSFDVNAAVEAYLATISGTVRANSDAYFEGGYWITLWTALLSIAIYWAILHFGYASRLARWADRVTGERPWRSSVLFLVPYFLLVAVLTLPWSIYTGFVREQQYGLSTQSFGPWFGEWALSAVISTIFLTVAVAIILAIVRKTAERWWVWSSMSVIALMVFAIAIAPVAISPLFNDYTPMPEGPVKQQVLSMARANGVPADNVYVVDESAQSNRISANVQGLGPTIRISLNDNLLEQSTPAQIRTVMAHEIGHYVLNHIWKLVFTLAVIILALFGFINWMMPKLIDRFGARWGALHGADTVTVPMGGILVTIFFLALTPVFNTAIRVQEQEADVFGINASRTPDGLAQMAMKVATYRKLDPGKWEEIIFYNHPSGRARAETAMKWKAEHLGEPGVE